MLEIVPKRIVFEYLESANLDPNDISLPTIQAAGISACTAGTEMSRIAEVVSGEPIILETFDLGNEFLTLDLKESSPRLKPFNRGRKHSSFASDSPVNLLVSCGQFDSIDNAGLTNALERMLSFVRPGGLMFHGITLYVEDSPSAYWLERVAELRAFADRKNCALAGQDEVGDLTISMSHATLSDRAMFSLYRDSKAMKNLRISAQAVALIIGYRRIA
ncbi:MAG: hypothetical protein NXH95_10800 [Pseudomonadaceae bacterium]|nr:hypothetical protein [Pseudomonadaceae bacterium]